MKIKKILHVILSTLISLSIFCQVNIPVNAYCSRTQSEALSWVQSQVGNSIDYDGSAGVQCVDLAKAYYAYLGVEPSTGNGADYTDNTLPSGWQRLQGAVPQPGDILVYTGGYGHVAIYESDYVTYHQNFDTLSDNFAGVKRVTYKYNTLSNLYWGVIRPDFITHTHSYTSSVTQNATCTENGIRNYTCSCGNSYTETISALNHTYTDTVIEATTDSHGYVFHECSNCGYSYKDNFIDPIIDTSWTYTSELPDNVTSDEYEIQYQNIYQTESKNSPGSEWVKGNITSSSYENYGNPYESMIELEQSETRVLQSYYYYHYCSGSKGNEANYEYTSTFNHYDAISSNGVYEDKTGLDSADNRYRYYYLKWDNGTYAYCKTGVSCDGTYGNHSDRCYVWYKCSTYQDRIKVDTYNWTKKSDWKNEADESANQILYRYKKIQTNKGDLNADNKISVSDVMLLKMFLIKIDVLDEYKWETADINNDNKVNVFDLILLKRSI